MWESNSQHFPASSLITPGDPSFCQLHDIQVTSLPETFKSILLPFSHDLLNPSQFCKKTSDLYRCIMSIDISIYRHLDLLFLWNCSAGHHNPSSTTLSINPLVNHRMNVLVYVGEGSSPQAQRLREGHRNDDRGRNPSSLINAKGHPELTTTKAIEKNN